jgi:hypothetical protein
MVDIFKKALFLHFQLLRLAHKALQNIMEKNSGWYVRTIYSADVQERKW